MTSRVLVINVICGWCFCVWIVITISWFAIWVA